MEDIKILKEKMAIKKMELQLEEFDIRMIELSLEIEKVNEQKSIYAEKIIEKKKELGMR